MQKNISLSKEDLQRFSALFARSIWQQLHDAFERRSKENGITRTELANRLCVDKSVISRRLNGTCNFTLEVVSDMARALEFKPVLTFIPYEDLSTSGNKEPYLYHPTVCAVTSSTTNTKTTKHATHQVSGVVL